MPSIFIVAFREIILFKVIFESTTLVIQIHVRYSDYRVEAIAYSIYLAHISLKVCRLQLAPLMTLPMQVFQFVLV